jgi:hypothetical protein
MKKTKEQIALPKMGRPVSMPSKSKMMKLGYLTLVVDDVRKILNESRRKNPSMDDRSKMMEISVSKDANGKPVVKPEFNSTRLGQSDQFYSDKDIGLILEFFGSPGILDANDVRGLDGLNKSQREWFLNEIKSAAIHWAKLFADAPDAMIDALPKIRQRINKTVGNPRQKVIHRYCLMNDLQRFSGVNEFCKRFWVEPANVIADELKRELREPSITVKTIEHARAVLREKLAEFPPQVRKLKG